MFIDDLLKDAPSPIRGRDLTNYRNKRSTLNCVSNDSGVFVLNICDSDIQYSEPQAVTLRIPKYYRFKSKYPTLCNIIDELKLMKKSLGRALGAIKSKFWKNK